MVFALVLGAMLGAQLKVAPRSTVAYASFAPLNTDIFIADADGANAAPFLPGPGLDDNASFSFDGQWVVFTSDRGGSTDLYRARIDGSDLTRLTDDPAFDDQGAVYTGWTLSRVQLFAQRQRRCLASRSANTGAPQSDRSSERRLPAGVVARRRLAGVLERPRYPWSARHVRHRADDGHFRRAPRRLRAAAADRRPWRRRHGPLVAERRSNRLLPRAGRRNTTPQLAEQFRNDPNCRGRRLGRRRENLDRWTGREAVPRSVSDTRGRVLNRDARLLGFTDGRAGLAGEFQHPDWTPDRRRMIYHRDLGGDWPPFWAAYSRDPNIRLLRTGVYPNYSPDGTRLTMNSGRTGIAHNGILLMRPDGSQKTTLFEDPVHSALAPVWSPRGDRLAFGLGRFFPMVVPAPQGVAAGDVPLDVASRKLTVLTDGSGNVGFSSWSPDGERLVYRAWRNDASELRIIDTRTRTVTPLLTDFGRVNFPSWSPVGSLVQFTSDHDGDGNYEIYTIDVATHRTTRVTNSPGNDGHGAWSPDGRWIAFSSVRQGFKDEAVVNAGNPQGSGDLSSAGRFRRSHRDRRPVRRGHARLGADWTPLRAETVAAAVFGGPVLPTRARVPSNHRRDTLAGTSSDLPLRSVGFLAYLEPADADSGALRVVPGITSSSERQSAGSGATCLRDPSLPGHVVATEPGDMILLDERVLHASFGGGIRQQWRVDYLRAPADRDVNLTKSYFASIYTPDWDGGYDVDRYPSYGPDWRRSGRVAVARLEALGVYEVADLRRRSSCDRGAAISRAAITARGDRTVPRG